MTTHYLRAFFEPESVAVIGASERIGSQGTLVLKNIIDNGFEGGLYPVNPKHQQVQGLDCYESVDAIGEHVDLAVVCTPPHAVPDVIRDCGERGIRAAVIVSTGFRRLGSQGFKYERLTAEHAKRWAVRLIGPDCIGLLRPSRLLNATYSISGTLPGNLALVSQSSAICATMLDWAYERKIGFSAAITLGETLDVDFGEILDFLAIDPQTRAILIYVEGVHQARRFMSGLRAAARVKPVIVVKAGREPEGSRAAVTHSGALLGADDVFDAALARAGAVRAYSIDQLFSAAQILSNRFMVNGNRLAIVTNGGGPGIMATDRAVHIGVAVPALGDKTLETLNKALPPHWSRNNPIDLFADADAKRYQTAIETCFNDPNIDGVLAMMVPHPLTQPGRIAETLLEIARNSPKPLLACCLGADYMDEARETLAGSRVPLFDQPEAGVEAFAHLASFQRSQKLLMQVPGPLSLRHEPNVQGARLIMENVLSEGRNYLNNMESKAVLTAFGIPVVRTVEARTPSEALVLAESVGYPVAMKISSPDIVHKSRIGGVRLNIGSAQAVRSAFTDLMNSVQSTAPDIKVNGVTVEPMHGKEHGRELIVGVVRDPVFGPVIIFGAGGTMVELIHDRAVALPPLNEFIARDLVERTRVAGLLGPHDNAPAINRQALEHVLLRVSDMVCKLPFIQSMDINPLVVDDKGALAVDARFNVDFPPASPDRYAHMAIYPYPTHLVKKHRLPDNSEITLRPIRPEDAEMEQAFVNGLSKESRYFRFMETLNELSPAMLVRLTQIDYDREMALLATENHGGQERMLGVARYTINPDGETCEFAIAIADDAQGKGLGPRLMNALMETAAAKGLREMQGEVLANNGRMLAMVRKLGFTVRTHEEDASLKEVKKRL